LFWFFDGLFFLTLPFVNLVVDKCGQLETLQKNDNATLFFVTTCLDVICFNDDEREKKRDSQVANKSENAVGAILEHPATYRTRHVKTKEPILI